MITSVLASFTDVLFSTWTALKETEAVPMENNMSVKKTNQEVIIAKNIITIGYLPAKSAHPDDITILADWA